jgi:hypothetical protein
MKISKLSDFFRGWFIGNFEPTLLKTPDFEVGLLSHKKGEVWPSHYHAESVEYNVLVSGSMTCQGVLLEEGAVFVFDKNEIADPVFHEDCKIIVVKVPSVPNDKVLVK